MEETILLCNIDSPNINKKKTSENNHQRTMNEGNHSICCSVSPVQFPRLTQGQLLGNSIF